VDGRAGQAGVGIDELTCVRRGLEHLKLVTGSVLVELSANRLAEMGFKKIGRESWAIGVGDATAGTCGTRPHRGVDRSALSNDARRAARAKVVESGGVFRCA
jgi:hypothetical protein